MRISASVICNSMPAAFAASWSAARNITISHLARLWLSRHAFAFFCADGKRDFQTAPFAADARAIGQFCIHRLDERVNVVRTDAGFFRKSRREFFGRHRIDVHSQSLIIESPRIISKLFPFVHVPPKNYMENLTFGFSQARFVSRAGRARNGSLQNQTPFVIAPRTVTETAGRIIFALPIQNVV